MHQHITKEQIDEANNFLAEQFKRALDEARKNPFHPWRPHGHWPEPVKNPRQDYPVDEMCPDCQREHAKRTCPCCGKRFTPTRPWMTLMAN